MTEVYNWSDIVVLCVFLLLPCCASARKALSVYQSISHMVDAMPQLAAVPTRETRRWGTCDGSTRWTGGVSTLSVVRAAIACLVLLCYGVDGAMPEEGGEQEVVKILELRVPSLPLPPSLLHAVNAGFNASLWSRNYTVANGLRVKRIVKDMEVHGGVEAINEAMEEHDDILLVQGRIGDEALHHLLPALEEHNLVSFAPLTGSSMVRNWNPHLYFVRADPAAELLALLRYAVNELRMWRLGFMYLQNVSFGDSEYTHATELLDDIDYELCCVFALESSLTGSADDGVFNATWEEFAATRPQAVIVFGAPVKDTAKFVTRMLTDKRTAGAYLLAPSLIQGLILSEWRKALEGGVPLIPGQVIATGTNPLAKDTRYEAIKRFQSVMRDYLSNENTVYNSTEHFLEDDNDGETMVAGWIVGEVLCKALSSRVWVRDRESFRRSLYNQRRYLIDDLVIGDYGDDCSAISSSEGGICRCNQGGRTVYMKRFVEEDRTEKVVEGIITFPLSQCYTNSTSLPVPLNVIAFEMTDNPFASATQQQITFGVQAALKAHYTSWQEHSLTLEVTRAAEADAHDVLAQELGVRRIHAVTGITTDALLDFPNLTFIDGLLLRSRRSKFRRNVIHLSPTLEQEFFVLAQFFGSTRHGTAHAVIRSNEGAAIVDVLRRSLVTFGGSLRSSALLAGGDALGDYLPHKGDVFVVGLAAADAAVIAEHLAKNRGVRVLVLFAEVSLFYDEFVAAFNGSGVAERLVFATSLPHWADINTTSETVQRFHAAVEDTAMRKPLALRSFASTLLLETVLSRMDVTQFSATLLADFFYNHIAIAVGDMLYGPFEDGTKCLGETQADVKDCAKNYGAARISVWSMARVLDPAVPELFPAVTPLMVYREHNTEGLSKDELIGVIIGSISGGVLLVALFASFCCRGDPRDNNYAPKEPTEPVTLVFTDIESSTAQWSACPEIMPDANPTLKDYQRMNSSASFLAPFPEVY
ncbi:receptor-type adenylate cyclase [Trypanosoma grayi]|uniref:receptor-type adenylate cyclase n=1 Tax=Trypanosoma grayi TaxID=71804 RepID=UPI0004F414F5|nr:receptor-type adenylate cyclase [Trypanosoma grayi]KEG06936.1 receptor-type adenylate cyclase [Trypanosoma grayi]